MHGEEDLECQKIVLQVSTSHSKMMELARHVSDMVALGHGDDDETMATNGRIDGKAGVEGIQVLSIFVRVLKRARSRIASLSFLILCIDRLRGQTACNARPFRADPGANRHGIEKGKQEPTGERKQESTECSESRCSLVG
jgi:hypothetical protein